MGGMVDVTHFPGLISAILTLILVGVTLTYFVGRFPKDLWNGWRPHDPFGYIPGVIEEPKYEVDPGVGGFYPYFVGMIHAITTFIKYYVIQAGVFLAIVFFGELLVGWHPASFPNLYYLGGFALLVAIGNMRIVAADTLHSKHNLGYRGL